jgi:hypothetical protein
MKPLGALRAGADRYFFILCLSPRRRLEQTLDLRVEVPGDCESCLTPVGSDEARHRVVGQVHAISALVDEDRDRCVRCCVGNGLHHLLHDERITDDEAEDLRPLCASFLTQDFAGVKPDELHQI